MFSALSYIEHSNDLADFVTDFIENLRLYLAMSFNYIYIYIYI